MDIRIRGKVDGVDTAAILHERFGVPVVYLTAYADAQTIDRAKKSEPLGYLVKPVKQTELRSAVEIALYRSVIERRLKERERWFSTTLQSIADAVIAVDLAGKITFMNSAAEKLTGTSFADAGGKSAHDVIRLRAASRAGELVAPLDLALSERRRVELPEGRLEVKGREVALVADSASPVTENGELLGAVMVLREVTEQKRLQQRLEIADRLASLGTMAAGVAHEVNNPLAVVVGNADLVLESLRRARAALTTAGIAPDVVAALEDAEAAQTDLQSAAGRVTRIVEDLRAFSRPAADAADAADPARAVEWAVRATSRELGSRARVVSSLAKTPRVALDETRLGQVLVNLLINAAHAIEPGRVDCNCVTVSTGLDEAGNVTIEVEDSGSGIPEDVLPHVFEPFFTTKSSGIGTGLGLAICHGIVAGCGGKIDVESRVGTGTCFRVVLPPAPPLKVASRPVLGPLSPEISGRLLVIDDDELVLRALTRQLKMHTVVGVTSARQALDRLERGERFDVIVSDLMMPEMTGVEFFETLLERFPCAAQQVIFMTGGALTPKVASFLASVPNSCLMKPCDSAALGNAVQELLKRHL